MNNTNKSPQISLHIPPKLWQQFQQCLLSARSAREETIGFLFCKRHQVSKRNVRYLPQAWVVPAPDCYEHQSESGLELKQEFHAYLLEQFVKKEKLDVVHIHTHSSRERPQFSYVDDVYESEYARFLSSHFKKKPRLISGVFDETLQHSQFRLWDRKGTSFEEVNCVRSWLEPTATSNSEPVNLMFSRQQLFGAGVQKQLGALTVALIGCGGIGSIFAELLGRLGVKNWILADGDRIEPVNLNRLPAATPEMAEQQWYKVHYVKHLIKCIYATGSRVKAIPASIADASAQREVVAADLIVVATDNHSSRQIAQELALATMRPLLCLGTHIDFSADNHPPRLYCRITMPPLGGGWCLMCGNIINLHRAALESAPAEIHQLAAREGYVEGVGDPAVFWLNSLCASTAVGVVHGMLSGFLEAENGLDWVFEFPQSHWLKANPEHLGNRNCYFCGCRT